MQIGLLTDSLSTMTRAEALDTAADLGVQTVEIGLGGTDGGWSPAPHADLTELLTDPAARDTLRRDVTSRGLRLEAFNAAGNPLHPVEGARDDRVLRGAIQLAEEFEVGTVVTMSGLPANPGDTFPAWITTSGRRRTCACSNTSGPSPSTTGAPSPTRPAAAA
jgi:sugar phosphate isomerase/epimerase